MSIAQRTDRSSRRSDSFVKCARSNPSPETRARGANEKALYLEKEGGAINKLAAGASLPLDKAIFAVISSPSHRHSIDSNLVRSFVRSFVRPARNVSREGSLRLKAIAASPLHSPLFYVVSTQAKRPAIANLKFFKPSHDLRSPPARLIVINCPLCMGRDHARKERGREEDANHKVNPMVAR